MKQSTEKLWAMASHLGAALMGPFSGLCAMVIFFVFKDKSKFIGHHSYQAMWFFFCIWAAGLVASLIGLGFVTVGLWFVQVIFAGVGSFRALKGEWYEYPITSKVARRAMH